MIMSLESIIPEPRLPSHDDLVKLTVPELKEICRSRELVEKGTKAEIIQRITELKKTQEDHISIVNTTDEFGMITESMVQDKMESVEQVTEEESGTFTKQEFVEGLFENTDDDDKRRPFNTLYATLIQHKPIYNLKELGIKPGLYLKQCSDFVDIFKNTFSF